MKHRPFEKIAFIGGDERQICAAKFLSEKGYEIALYGFDKFSGDIGSCTRCMSLSDALCKSICTVLPMPVSGDGINVYMKFDDKNLLIESVLDKAGESVILGGRTDKLCNSYKSKIIDYFEREELVIANAYLTAESAVALASREIKWSIRDEPVLVMGYGRIGKMLCMLLKAMGCNVFASARKRSDFEWIRAFGYSPVDTSKVCDTARACKLVFNTIPNLVLGEETLKCMPKDCLIIDLASKPGGVDFEAAEKCGIKVIWALALPGNKLPVSAGKAVGETILAILEDMEVI